MTEASFTAEDGNEPNSYLYAGKTEDKEKLSVGPGIMLQALYTIHKPLYRINISGSIGAADVADFLIKMASIDASIHFPRDDKLSAGPHIGIDWHVVGVQGDDPAHLKIKPRNPGLYAGLLVQRYFEKARIEIALDYQYMLYDYEMSDDWYTYSDDKINMSGFRLSVATSFRLFGH